MPHQCTDCGHAFPDGSKEMLSGCPDCGGNTFQYLPEGAEPASFEPTTPPRSGDDGLTGRAAATVKEWVAERARPDYGDRPEDAVQTAARTETASHDEIAVRADPTPRDVDDSAVGDAAAESDQSREANDTTPAGESTSDSSSPQTEGDQHAAADAPPGHPTPVDADDRPDLDDLRDELNDQFESIRIVAPGEYELNLVQLYEREEHVIALREDGRYVIDFPDARRQP